MDKDQIRENLAGYRPELYHGDDPLIEESLKAARADPELSSWLDEQIEFDREFSGRIAQVLPPAGSREAVLQVCRQPDETGSSRRRTLFRVSLVAVAVLLLSATGLVKFFLFPAPVEFTASAKLTEETFREQMAYFASQRFVLDQRFKQNSESASWLAAQGFPTLDEIPGDLVNYEGMGCKKISWQDRRVGLICFRNEGDEIVHLFILDRESLTDPGQADSGLEDVLIRHELETKGWRDDDRVYLLVGSKPGVKVDDVISIPMERT